MTVQPVDPEAPDFTRRHVNLADARLGAEALAASDEFFAASERMLNPEPAQFIPGKYDTNGKWMDGWESRRKRGPGHDWCVVRLARPGRIHGVDLDTSHFTGNYPPAASIEACHLASGDPDAGAVWFPLLPAVNLGATSFLIDTTTGRHLSRPGRDQEAARFGGLGMLFSADGRFAALLSREPQLPSVGCTLLLQRFSAEAAAVGILGVPDDQL